MKFQSLGQYIVKNFVLVPIIFGLIFKNQILLACPQNLNCIPASQKSAGPVTAIPLNPARAYIADHLKYFQTGVGIDSASGLPYESVNSLGQVDARTQPTLIGFYLQILAAAIKGDLRLNWLTRSAAIASTDLVLSQLLFIQQTYGWNGLIPWMYLDPMIPSAGEVAFVDNANLSQSIAVLIGALESSSEFELRALLIQKANQFLDAQQTGYSLFYSPNVGKIHGSYNTVTHQFHPTYYVDRFMNEFRSALAFIILRYEISQTAWNSLAMIYRNYQLEGGETIENLVPYDGSAFQAFWPSMVANELAIPEMAPVLSNYLRTHLDFAKRNKVAGIVSACLLPEGVYYGKAGLPHAAETLDSLATDVGSVYALAAASLIDSGAVLAWLDSIKEQAPQTYGTLGFFDSARTANDFSNTYLGIDQASVAIGLLGKSGGYFDRYLENRMMLEDFRYLYESKLATIESLATPMPNAPNIWSSAVTTFHDAYFEGTLNNFQNPISQLHGITFNYQNVAADSWGGHYWLLNPTDARGKTLVISASTVVAPGDIKIELKSGNLIVYTQVVSVPSTTAFHTYQVILPSTFNFSAITQVSVILEPWRTGIRTANFHIHQLGFYTD